MKKKIISFLLAAVMIISMIPAASAASQCLAVDKTAVDAGETITLTYTVPNAIADANAINLIISFDTNLFEATSVTAAELADAWMSYTDASEANSAGEVVLGAMTMSDFDIAAGTVLITAVFTAKSDAAGSAEFTVAEADIQGESGSLNASGGIDSTPVYVTVYSEISDEQAIAIEKPVKNGTPQTTIAATTKYTGSIQWVGSPSKFAANTAYAANVTLTAKTGYKFANTASVSVAGAESVTEKTVAADGSTMSFKVIFEATAAKELSSIAVTTKPSDLTYTHGETLNTAGMVVTAAYDDGSAENVTASAVISYNNGTALRKGDTSVSISYSGKTATLSGLSVAAKELSISGLTATNRVYNGETSVVLTGGILNGKIAGDDVSVTMPTSGTIASANAGTGKVVTVAKPALSGADKDCYTLADITGITVDITAASISPSVTVEGWTYGSAANDPVLFGNTYGADVTYEYKLASADDSAYATVVPTNVGNYTVRATIAATANSSGNTCTANFSIARKSVTNAMIQAIADQIFIGSALEPVITVKDGSKTLTLTTDYTVSYTANTNVGTATVTITGAGNYTGTASKTFAINAKTITEADFTTLGTATKTYTGSALTQTITPNGLIEGTDYTVAYSANTNAGTAKYVITGIGNYTGSFEKTFTINPKTITEADFTTLGVADKTYTGEALTQTIASELVKDTDYTVVYISNTNVGTAKYTITGKGNYTGSFEKAFVIAPKTISAADFTTLGVADKTYNGEALTQTIASELVKDTDYTVVYTSNTNVGTAKYTITGKGNYTGSFEKTFVIAPKTITAADFTTLGSETKTYTGSALTQTITPNGLTEGTDYTVAYSANTNAGTAKYVITGIGNYSGSFEKTFTITPKAIAAADFTALGVETKTYTGSALTQTITPNGLTEGTDYTVAYSANTNAGTAKYVITGIGNYTGSFEKTFTINPKTITEADFTTLGVADKTYTGSAQTQTVASSLAKGTDYTIAYENNTNVGTARYIITGKGNYTGTITKSFTIGVAEYTVVVVGAQEIKVGSGLNKITVTNGVVGTGVNGENLAGAFAWYTDVGCTSAAANSDISGLAVGVTKTLYWKFTPNANANYNTAPKTGSVVFTIVDGDPQTLTFDSNTVTKTYGDANFVKAAANDRTNGGAITYASSNPEVAIVNASTGEVTLLKKGNTTITATAAAVPGMYASGTASYTLTVNAKALSNSMIQSIASQTYTGSAITPAISVKDNGKTLALTTDYTVAYFDNTNVGTATVTITGAGNYSGTASKTFAITAKTITAANFTTLGTETKTYTGSALTQTITPNGLTEGTDYTVAYSANTNAGTAKYVITGIGNYTGSFEKTFTINPKTITEADFTTLGVADKTYTGEALTQTIASELVKDTDYTVVYTSNTNVGTAKYVITGKGNYTGSFEKTFTIVPKTISASDFTALGVETKTYTGSALTQTITPNGLTEGTDYTVAYSANTNVGTAKYVITGKGNYTGSFEKAFVIAPKTIAAADFTTLGVETKTYNGSAQTQTVASSLTEGTDYTVAYSANTNAGTAKYVITGKGNYTGSFEKTFVIAPKVIAEADFTTLGVADKTYTGSAQTQTVASSLTEGTDYTIVYENNTYVGAASYTITGKGNYSGTISKTFNITAAEYDLSRIPASIYIGGTYTPNTIKNAVSNAGAVTIDSIVVYKADGTTQETDATEAAKIAVFDASTDTVTAKGPGKIQITYSIAANNIDNTGADEYSAKANQTITVTFNIVPPAPPAPPASDETVDDKEEEKTNLFVDIKDSDYYYDAVLWAAEKGITLGTTETTFSPSAACTRGQMMTFLWRAAGSPEPKNLENKFSDVNEDSQYYKAILWAVENGITLGTGDGSTFSPNATCTRAQMAAFLYRSANSPVVDGNSKFTDVAESSYYAQAVLWAVENGITLGTGDGSTFSPDATCTRGQMVAFLYRYFAE